MGIGVVMGAKGWFQVKKEKTGLNRGACKTGLGKKAWTFECFMRLK